MTRVKYIHTMLYIDAPIECMQYALSELVVIREEYLAPAPCGGGTYLGAATHTTKADDTPLKACE